MLSISFLKRAVLLSFFCITTLSVSLSAAEEKSSVQVSEPITVSVIGDSLADGIWGGLFRQLQPRKQHDFTLVRHTRNGTGLVRPDVYDWQQGIIDVVDSDHPDVIIICFGLNDRQDNFVDGKRKASFKSPAWKADYENSIVKFIQSANKNNALIYWIGLPSMRDQITQEDAIYLNNIFEEQSKNLNISFISWHDISIDNDGKYASHLKANDGKIKLVRADDGMHFTSIGYEVLAKNLLDMMALAITNGAIKHQPSLKNSNIEKSNDSDDAYVLGVVR